jgi:AcrR family transcriptional regulator
MSSRVRQGKDRRIQRTETLLRGALGALLLEKPYEEIVVKEILGRANVGRSAFYTHFADKDDLLRSCVLDLVRSEVAQDTGQAAGSRPDDILWFSLPLLTHIERHLGSRGRGDVRQWRAVHERLQAPIAELIAMEAGTALRGSAARRAPPVLLISWIASTFVLVLNWWVEGGTPVSAREANGLFRALVEPSLADAVR